MFISNFIAVPRIVLYDQTCSQTDKLVSGVINSLSNNKGYCYANNSYFARELNVGTKTISNSISNLKKKKYITIKYKNGKRYIYINKEIAEKENAKKVEKNLPISMEENYYHKRKYNNKKINNINRIEPIIEVDVDGVELWNGKRCESIPASKEEQLEMEELLKDFK